MNIAMAIPDEMPVSELVDLVEKAQEALLAGKVHKVSEINTRLNHVGFSLVARNGELELRSRTAVMASVDRG